MQPICANELLGYGKFQLLPMKIPWSRPWFSHLAVLSVICFGVTWFAVSYYLNFRTFLLSTPDKGARQNYGALQDGVTLQFAGEARTLRSTICSIHRYLIRPLVRSGHSVHVVIAAFNGDPNKQDYSLFKNLEGVSEVHYREFSMPTNRSSVHPNNCAQHLLPKYDKLILRHFGQSYLPEYLGKYWYRWKADLMRNQLEQLRNWTFSWNVLVRPDMLYVAPLPDLRKLNKSLIYVPDFHHFGGLHTSFMVGSSAYFEKGSAYYRVLCSEAWVSKLPDPDTRRDDPGVSRRGGFTSERLTQLYFIGQGLQVQTFSGFYFFRQRMLESTPLLLERTSVLPSDVRLNRKLWRKAHQEALACTPESL